MMRVLLLNDTSRAKRVVVGVRERRASECSWLGAIHPSRRQFVERLRCGGHAFAWQGTFWRECVKCRSCEIAIGACRCSHPHVVTLPILWRAKTALNLDLHQLCALSDAPCSGNSPSTPIFCAPCLSCSSQARTTKLSGSGKHGAAYAREQFPGRARLV